MTVYTTTIGSDIIVRDDGASIPPDPANRDYAEYLAWVEEGGITEILPNPNPPQAAPLVGETEGNAATAEIMRVEAAYALHQADSYQAQLDELVATSTALINTPPTDLAGVIAALVESAERQRVLAESLKTVRAHIADIYTLTT